MIRPATDEVDYLTPGTPPPRASTIGLWLFLAALTMLFAASLVGYLLIRHSGNRAVSGPIQLPNLLYFSTAMVIGVSITIGLAVSSLHRERQQSFRVWIILSLLLGIAFIAIQTPAMIELIQRHEVLIQQLRRMGAATGAGTALYGLIFVLVLLHALHVVGGIIVLVRVSVQGVRGRYDHEHFLPVKHAAMYWHFLDVVWIVMFSTFLLTR